MSLIPSRAALQRRHSSTIIRLGIRGCPYSYPIKAFELYKRGAELGSIEAHDQISKAYKNGFGEGIKWDMDKAQYHMEMAAKGGHE